MSCLPISYYLIIFIFCLSEAGYGLFIIVVPKIQSTLGLGYQRKI